MNRSRFLFSAFAFLQINAFLCQVKQVRFFNDAHYKVEKLNNSSKNDELSPVITNDKLFYLSNTPVEVGIKNFDADNSNLYRLFYTDKNKNLKTAQQLFPGFLKDVHEGPLYINKVEDQVWFTCNSSYKQGGKNLLTIQEAVKGEKGWVRKNISFFDSLKTACCHPYLFANETKMIFSSDIAGLSLGGMDLFSVEKVNGKWTNLKNLGSVINSKANEAFPYIDPEGNLFFSSNIKNTATYDIYYINLFTPNDVVRAVPSVINSDLNETGISWDLKTNSGFFSSNRDGNDDIYSVKLLWPKTEKSDTMSIDKYCYEFFEGSSLGLDDTTQMAYEWDFGDGSKARGLKTEHCFEKEGMYSISLNIIDKTTNVLFFNQVNYALDVTDEFPLITDLNGNIFSWTKKNMVDSVENVFIEIDGTPFYSGADSIIELSSNWGVIKEYYSVWKNKTLDTLSRFRYRNFKASPSLDTLLRIVQPTDVKFKIHLGQSDSLYTDITKHLTLKDTITYSKDKNNKFHYFVGNYSDIDSTLNPIKTIKKDGYAEATIIAFTKDDMVPGQTLLGAFEDYFTKKGLEREYSYFYKSGQYKIKPSDVLKTDSLLQRLDLSGKTTFLISSYTDKSGSEEFNRKLSQKRGLYVKNLLLKLGVRPSRIKLAMIEYDSGLAPQTNNEKDLKRSDLYIKYEK